MGLLYSCTVFEYSTGTCTVSLVSWGGMLWIVWINIKCIQSKFSSVSNKARMHLKVFYNDEHLPCTYSIALQKPVCPCSCRVPTATESRLLNMHVHGCIKYWAHAYIMFCALKYRNQIINYVNQSVVPLR